jgi:hypothetical protein
MTRPPDYPTPTPSTRPRRPLPYRLPTFGLSVTSLVATGLAAVTATFAASYLGVAGTVIGAAIASVLTSAGKEVYYQSLRRTGSRVREVVPVTRVMPRTHDGSHPAPYVAPTPAATVPGEPAPPDQEAASEDLPPALPTPVPARRSPEATRWRRIAMSAVAVFVAVLAVITGIEVIGGRPVSDIVRGDGGSGTSFFGHVQVQTRTKTVPPVAPTITKTVIPKVVVTTPTVTQTAPTVTRTNSTPAPSSSQAPSSSTAPTSPTTRTSGSGAASGSKTP